MKVCPFHAIVYVPVPCEESCPVDAITKDEKGREVIDYNKCIFCGKCVRSCPFGAVMEKSQIIDIIKHIKNNKSLVAMIAPSIIGQYDASINKIATAIKKIGFKYVVEVALGADITAKIESEEFIERMKKGDKLMGTSCCPAYTESVKKHAKDFQNYVSHAKTPMAYTASLVKEKLPDCIRVFIGPCIAKKHEGLFNEDIDYVLTFEELDSLFNAKNIKVNECEDSSLDIKEATNIGRGFPISTGVASALKQTLNNSDIEIREVFIDGLTKQNVRLLNSYGKGNCPGNLVEVMSCEGGCISGPAVITKYNLAKKRVDDFLKKD